MSLSIKALEYLLFLYKIQKETHLACAHPSARQYGSETSWCKDCQNLAEIGEFLESQGINA